MVPYTIKAVKMNNSNEIANDAKLFAIREKHITLSVRLDIQLIISKS